MILMFINVLNVRELTTPISLKERILKINNSMQSKDCKICSLPKEEHLSEVSFGGVLLGCKFENNFLKSNFLSFKRLISKWI
tara:strand:+ start:387 stop:632 length:246 start_codon:yes stop_codon:yes gene_type:complete